MFFAAELYRYARHRHLRRADPPAHCAARPDGSGLPDPAMHLTDGTPLFKPLEAIRYGSAYARRVTPGARSTRRSNPAALFTLSDHWGMATLQNPPQHALWVMKLRGQYLRPDGTPHQGFVTMTPEPISVTRHDRRHTVHDDLADGPSMPRPRGSRRADLLNPNDPTIRPGPATARRWGYCVGRPSSAARCWAGRWTCRPSVGDGEVLDMAKVARRDEVVARPADWFPHHLMDTPVQASRIFAEGGPADAVHGGGAGADADGPGRIRGTRGWVPPFGRCGCCCRN
jgi:hypothetical protein